MPRGGARVGAGRPKGPEKPPKPPPGGAREGAGRPEGRKNNATVERDKAIAQIIDEMLAHLQPEKRADLSPLEIMLIVARALLENGDGKAAAMTASLAAPYIHAKPAAVPADIQTPPELRADPPSRPDEPGPLEVID